MAESDARDDGAPEPDELVTLEDQGRQWGRHGGGGEDDIETGDALPDLVDGWGNLIIYFHNRDYKRIADDPAPYTALEEDVEAVPWKNEDGTFSQPMSFQLFSMGPDGIPNTEDDIRAWVK